MTKRLYEFKIGDEHVVLRGYVVAETVAEAKERIENWKGWDPGGIDNFEESLEYIKEVASDGDPYENILILDKNRS